VTVFEQAPAFEPVGAGIALAPNGVRALEWLGLSGALAAREAAEGDSVLQSDSGRVLMRTSMSELHRRFGAASYGLHRAQLHGMLLDAASGARLRTGCRVTQVLPGPDAARVAFTGPDGAGDAEADLVVVGDGVHSRVRHALFPEHPGARYVGYRAWRGIVPSSDAPLIAFEGAWTETWGRDRRFGIAPLSGGALSWYATELVPAGADRGDGLDSLAARYQGWPDPIPQVLTLTASETLLCHDIYYLAEPLPSFVRDQVALVGDAAHAITPDLAQGGCQALEDAVTLAAVVGSGRTRPGVVSLRSALNAYDAQRRPRRQRIGRMAARVSRVVRVRNPVAVGLRNAAVTLTPPALSLRSSASVFTWVPPGGGEKRDPRPHRRD
jgi:2-polyprenyl-6-methoxyphenol hydroxylase-like FAD-dependent oxidoreductase